MTLSDLKNKIDGYIQDLVFTLSDTDETDSGWANINRLIQKVGTSGESENDSTLTVYGTSLTTTLDSNTQTVVFEGFIDDSFRIFQRTGAYANATLTFSVDTAGAPQLVIDFTIAGSYRLPDSFPIITSDYPDDLLNSVVFDTANFTTDSADLVDDETALTLQFSGELQPEGPYKSLDWLFLTGNPTLSGSIELASTSDGSYVPVIETGDNNFVQTFIDLESPKWGYLADLTFSIQTRIYTTFDTDEQQFLSSVDLVTDFNKPNSGVNIPIIMPLHGPGQGLLTFFLNSGKEVPDLSGSGAEGSDKLDAYSIFLDQGSPKDVFGETDISYGALSLTDLAFTLHPATQKFTNLRLAVNLGTDAGWSIVEDRFALENVSASMSIGDPSHAYKSMNVNLLGVFQIGDDENGVNLYVQVDLPSPAQVDSPSLSFAMGLVEGDEIEITKFLDSFADRDSTLEKENGNSLSITALELSGDIASNSYSFEAETSGSVEIIDGLEFKDLTLNAAYANKSTTLEFDSSFTLNTDNSEVDFYMDAAKDSSGAWSLTGGTATGEAISLDNLLSGLTNAIGVPKTLPAIISGLGVENLAATYNTQSRNFTFSGGTSMTIVETEMYIGIEVQVFHRQDGTTEKSFVGSLNLGSDTLVGFDMVFDVSEDTLMLASYSDSSGQTEFDIGEMINSVLSTEEVPAGLTLTLNSAFMAYLKDENSSQFAFAVDVGDGLNLSNLPLVGKLYPKGKTISLNYQLQYASSEFSSNNAATVNANLPAAVHPLITQTDGTVKQGLDLAVSMNLGEDIIPFDLDLAATGSDDDPVNGGATSIPDDTPPVVSKNTGSAETLKWFDIQKSFGPVHFNRIGAALNSDELTFALDASFSMGGLNISLDGLAITSPLTDFSPTFDLKGIGIDYANPVLEIGAAFLRETITDPVYGTYDEYDGGVLLRMEDLTISAIGSYAYVNNQPSLFVYAALDYPLGGPPFFFVTGLSLGFGYNRALKVPSVDKVLEFPLVAEAMNGKSLGSDAGKDELSAELESIHSYVPVSIGQMFLAAGINFTTFKLIDSTMLLAASFGNRFELDLLGVSTLVVPPETNGKTSLAVIQMALKGSFIPDEGFVGLSGQLTSASYILSKDCRLSGGFAFYAWYSGDYKDEFVATIGGYHPSFKQPDHFPSVPRLAFTWQLDEHTHMKGDAYFALCAHAVMAGGHFEAVFQKDSLKAWYKVGADFLLAWKPYHYEASIYVNIGASYTYHCFGTHHLSVDVGADVNIWGPEFGGHAKVDLGICSVGVDFGQGKDDHNSKIDWEEFDTTFLNDVQKCSVAISSGLVAKDTDTDDSELWIVNAKELKILTDGFIPAKQVNWFDNSSDPVSTTAFNSEIGVAPMEISSSDLNSTQTIKVQKWDGEAWLDDPANFTHAEIITEDKSSEVITKKAPSALWGQSATPGVNDDQFIKDTFAGLAIVPKQAYTPGYSRAIPTSYVQYETTFESDAFAWSTRTTFTDVHGDDETAARTVIRGDELQDILGITSSDVEDDRNAILAALGLSATIDLHSSVADDFVLAPQVSTASNQL